MEDPGAVNKDFSTISPSAKWVLLMKAHTKIPFALQVAELSEYPQKFTPDFESNDPAFWGRTLHFEGRYWSIDQLLSELPVTNILELSSGFSFRGLDFVKRKHVHYIDTDLPDMIERKKEFIAGFETADKKGELELLPLNALDEEKFMEIVSHFPPGEIAIVNEGLLVYFDTSEKERLCRIIRKVLEERGGYWITGDIYIKFAMRNIDPGYDPQTQKFLDDHNVENNRFDSIPAAEEFFKRMGFIIDKEANVDFTKLVAFPYVMKNATAEALEKFRSLGKIHTTWRLRVADERKDE